MKDVREFGDQTVRTHWDEEHEEWYFSIVDVVSVLTESVNPQVYWRVLKKRLLKEGNETVTNCNGLKMRAADGKMRLTDVANTEQLFRLIQSIPSPKAEPFKLWLAQVASERLDEMQDPELSVDRALEQYLRLGYSENWINQRLKSIEIRKELTDFSIISDAYVKQIENKLNNRPRKRHKYQSPIFVMNQLLFNQKVAFAT
jgi:hypothetical protein